MVIVSDKTLNILERDSWYGSKIINMCTELHNKYDK